MNSNLKPPGAAFSGSPAAADEDEALAMVGANRASPAATIMPTADKAHNA
jgi:hypothetical protein